MLCTSMIPGTTTTTTRTAAVPGILVYHTRRMIQVMDVLLLPAVYLVCPAVPSYQVPPLYQANATSTSSPARVLTILILVA